MPNQFILDTEGQPAFVVLPYAEWLLANPEQEDDMATKWSLLEPNGYLIRMPHGGPDQKLDVRQFVHACLRRGTVSMAINARKQAYREFKKETINSLDPILRRCFLPKDSPYVDTMQATVRLVDALVQTGVFERTMITGAGFYRPVNGIKIIESKAHAFLAQYGEPEVQIDPHRFIQP